MFLEKGDQNIKQLHCEALLMFDQHFESLATEVQIALHMITTISLQNKETGKVEKNQEGNSKDEELRVISGVLKQVCSHGRILAYQD